MNEYEQKQALAVMDRVMHEVMERSEQCERGVIAISGDGRGLALVGPDSILYAQVFFPGVAPFDMCLN